MAHEIQAEGRKWRAATAEMEDKVCIVLAYMLLEEEDANRKPRHMLDINLRSQSSH